MTHISKRAYKDRICPLCEKAFSPHDPRSRRCYDCQEIACEVCGVDVSKSIHLHRAKKGVRRLCDECYANEPLSRIRAGKRVLPAGSRRIDKRGYSVVKCKDGKWRFEHRVVMESVLGRALAPGEIVHHKDEDPLNNAPENLELCNGLREHLETHHAHQLKDPPRHHNGRRKKSDPGYVPIKPKQGD